MEVIIANAKNDWKTSRDVLQTLLPKDETVVGEIQGDYFEGDIIQYTRSRGRGYL
jgi:tRNA splicing ligase